MMSKLASLAVVAAAAAFLPAPSLARSGVVDITVAPPAPRHEVVPAARRGYVWAPGYWEWRRGRHHWVTGRWTPLRHGYVYRQPAWEQRGDRWHFNRGSWARGDRDHDGVPNRLDAHPDNPYRR